MTIFICQQGRAAGHVNLSKRFIVPPTKYISFECVYNLEGINIPIWDLQWYLSQPWELGSSGQTIWRDAILWISYHCVFRRITGAQYPILILLDNFCNSVIQLFIHDQPIIPLKQTERTVCTRNELTNKNRRMIFTSHFNECVGHIDKQYWLLLCLPLQLGNWDSACS